MAGLMIARQQRYQYGSSAARIQQQRSSGGYLLVVYFKHCRNHLHQSTFTCTALVQCCCCYLAALLLPLLSLLLQVELWLCR